MIIAGEVTVKWVEAFQTHLPMCIGGAIFGAARLKPKWVIVFLDTTFESAHLDICLSSKYPLSSTTGNKAWRIKDIPHQNKYWQNHLEVRIKQK